MLKIKRARSLVHSIAHHGVSALSWLHPLLGQECREKNINSVEFNLLSGEITTENFVASYGTLMAFSTLKQTFENIANKENVFPNQISNAFIVFGFEKDDWPSYCISYMSGNNGKEINIKVDGFGRKYHALSRYL